MIRTISMQVTPSSRPHAIPTRRDSALRTAFIYLVTIIGAAVLGAILVGHGLARSAAGPEVSGKAANLPGPARPADAAATPDAPAMRAAVQALHAFPDPYPASAAVAP